MTRISVDVRVLWPDGWACEGHFFEVKRFWIMV